MNMFARREIYAIVVALIIIAASIAVLLWA